MTFAISKSAFQTASELGLVGAPDIISYATGACALGQVLVARSRNGVCAIMIGDDPEELESNLAARFPKAVLVASEAIVRDDKNKATRFIEKPTQGLHLRLDMRGTPIQRRIWEKIRAISPGKTVSYVEMARWVGPLATPRMVASACAANPIALAIPCHRLVSSNGDLAGYRWGVERKRALIQKEAMAGVRVRSCLDLCGWARRGASRPQ
jgi:O-6-methylguanine DNA methyltransferase